MYEIIINKDENNDKTVAILEDTKLVEYYIEKEENERLEGNIYIGKVQNVLPGMQAAFVDIGQDKNTFIHLKDLLPKVDITKGKNNNNVIDIKDIIKPNMPILVQVKRDATHKKGAKVSTHISLVSRYFVLMPETKIVTISQKIASEEEKNRLLEIVNNEEIESHGIIIRTSAEGKSKEDLLRDLKVLIKRWNKIKEDFEEKLQNKDAEPKLLEKSYGLLEKIITDTIDKNINRIIVNSDEVSKEVNDILNQFDNHDKVNIEIKNEDLLSMYSINHEIEKASNRKVWLKCGGFIIIDYTEALTAIDVNTGKFTGKDNLENTILRVNMEASIEIAKQLRLRDIGGIIIIDYIDMKEETNKEYIVEVLTKELKKDRSKTQVMEFTKLNLLEMTRKHMFSNE